MITENEYAEILPHRKMILQFNQTGQYSGGDALHIANRLRQKYGIAAPINYGCDGCKVAAMNDLYEIMKEYESKTLINTR